MLWAVKVMKTNKLIIFLFVVTALLLQACGPDVQAGIATGIAQTQQISALETAAAAAKGGNSGQAQSSGEIGQSSSNSPLVSVSKNTNCRSGPRVDYTLLTTINVGQQVEVLKVSAFSDYVVVRNPNGNGDCWLFLQYANTTDFSAFNLPLATQPPTPYVWEGNWVFYLPDGGENGKDGENDLGKSVTIHQSGNSISGSFIAHGETISFSGSLSANHQVATGTWVNESSRDYDGTFVWQMKTNNLNQFVGSFGQESGHKAWCGARAGESSPSPCFGP
jgi:hypothetical protein